MSKIVFSWLSKNNDFLRDGSLSETSPNMDMHQYFYSFDKHILLISSEEYEIKAEIIRDRINAKYKHIVEIVNLFITDPIDIKEIYHKTMSQLSKFRDDQLDFFTSPGTPSMQIVWFIIHTSGMLNSKIFQGRKPEDIKHEKDRFTYVNIEKSEIPFGLIMSSQELFDKTEKSHFIGKSIEGIYEKARKIAVAENIPVIIRGENGTGKEHLANFIYRHSVRSKNDFIAMNCSAMNDSLLESRLFGYIKGAFSDAKNDTPGIFETYNGGTIFLDEIGDISPYMQQLLLRVVQTGEYNPVGSTLTKKTDIRIIAATNKNLEEAMVNGTFRNDLYYRLSVTQLMLPSLAERGSKEIKELIEFFLKLKASYFKKKKIHISNEVIKLLALYDYPGNIRELENIITHLYVFCNDEVNTLNDLPEYLSNKIKNIPITLKESFKPFITSTLKKHNYNYSETARVLDISLNTLKKYIQEFGIGIKKP